MCTTWKRSYLSMKNKNLFKNQSKSDRDNFYFPRLPNRASLVTNEHARIWPKQIKKLHDKNGKIIIPLNFLCFQIICYKRLQTGFSKNKVWVLKVWWKFYYSRKIQVQCILHNYVVGFRAGFRLQAVSSGLLFGDCTCMQFNTNNKNFKRYLTGIKGVREKVIKSWLFVSNNYLRECGQL